MPVPATEIVGELDALLTTATVPLASPALRGSKVTLSAVAWPGATVVPEAAPVTAKPVPVILTPEMVTSEFPELVRVIAAD